MLHVADDNFLQPNPGVSAGDHLVSGLVPLAALLAAAAAYPRVRPGTRAVLAFAVGLTGIVVGAVEAGYYTFSVGPSGDDFTGWVAAVAGAGARRSRRHAPVAVAAPGRQPDPPLRTPHRQGSRRRRDPRRAGRPVRHDVPHHAREPRPRCPQPDLGAAHEDVTLTTSDGLHLQGWYVPSRNGAAVIAFPGRKGPQAAHPDAGPPRVRRAALRPARRGRQRGRPQHVGLGRAARHPRRRRLPPAPAGRRPGPHRRHRLLGRRRADAAGSRRERRSRRRGLRGCRHTAR